MTTPENASAELLQLIDDIHGDTDHAEILLDKIISATAQRTAERLVRSLWGERITPGVGTNHIYVGAWNDGVDASIDKIQRGYLHTCAVCKTPIEYYDAPGGAFWAHEIHPENGHDAIPVRP